MFDGVQLIFIEFIPEEITTVGFVKVTLTLTSEKFDEISPVEFDTSIYILYLPLFNIFIVNDES